MNIINYSIRSELGLGTQRCLESLVDTYHFTSRLPNILQEREFDLVKTNINKIFCAQWLDESKVILGSKCNHLLVLDTKNGRQFFINTLKSHPDSVVTNQNCGIHSISINPSGTLLATGSENVNDIAVYRLPNLEPVCVGHSAHKNWIFDTVWIDDNHVVSGANDGTLALWKIDANDFDYDAYLQKNEDDDDELNSDLFDTKRRKVSAAGQYVSNKYNFKKPIKILECKKANRIRALACNTNRNEIAAISMNAKFHLFDSHSFEPTISKKLQISKENTCLAVNSDNSVYAIGSASHVQLLLAKNGKSLLPPIFIKKDIGVRSLNFRNNILSIGTGGGTVMFYDLRNLKFLRSEHEEKTKLQTKGGWILRNENYDEFLSYTNTTDSLHAVYAHCYDPSGTKLFTAGGPLTVGLYGHYAAVWQ